MSRLALQDSKTQLRPFLLLEIKSEGTIVCRSGGNSWPVTGQRSNQLNYVPSLFSYLYRKPACLVAFLRFNRFACVACFNLVEPNSEVNGHHGHQAKSPSKSVLQANTNPEQLSLPREMNCSRGNSDQYRLGDMLGTSDGN